MSEAITHVNVLPSDEVAFCSGPSRIAIHNLGETPLAFQVRFTSSGLRSEPAEGIVPPGKHIEATLTPVAEAGVLPHRIVVRTRAVIPGVKPGELWLDGAADEHLRCCKRIILPHQDGADVPTSDALGLKARLHAAERLVTLRSAACSLSLIHI